MRFTWRDRERTRAVELSAEGAGRYRAAVDGVEIEVLSQALAPDRLRLVVNGATILAEITAVGPRRFVRLGMLDFVIDRAAPGTERTRVAHGGGLEAPMPGVVARVMVAAGDEVKKGQPLVALEAMKMEHVIRAPRDGRVRRVAAMQGEMVNGGMAIVELE